MVLKSTLSLNPRLSQLHDYPFTRLNRLLEGVEPNKALTPISLAIGEPQHAPPPAALDALTATLSNINRYPTTGGQKELREAIGDWISRRYGLTGNTFDAQAHVLPVQGSREALFAAAQFVVDSSGDQSPVVLLPSPFYQIYEGAALMAGAEPVYLPLRAENNFSIDFSSLDPELLDRCSMVFLCNPSNPTGTSVGEDDYRQLLVLAEQHDFIIASDECYSEIYPVESEPLVGLLQVACARSTQAADDADPLKRVLVFNSLSKRSNLAGLRSGFVAGGKELISAFLKYRTYHGSAMPLHHQAASIAAWGDESHVIENRVAYRNKLAAAVEQLAAVSGVDISYPQGGFCLWLRVGGCDQDFARDLFEACHVVVLPGSFLARDVDGFNAGHGYIRMAMVHDATVCEEAVTRLVHFLGSR